MEDYVAKNISIPCIFSTDGCPNSSPTVLWFRYLSNTHENLCTPICTKSSKFFTSSAPGNKHSLQINKANVEDSAIYICGVAFPESTPPTSKQAGEGTVLVIRATKTYSQEAHWIMAAVSSVLFLYLVAILVTAKFFSKPKCNHTETSDLKGTPNPCSQGRGREISRAIAEELRKKKDAAKRRQGFLAKFNPKR
ncbi:immunoglobulin superfamily member 6 [Hemicordylus capensis]|uniref:immunoglobulin superfamily member 6 n=1 Tax=Hemicordylus capensis TaxID=884348 RepID=UPI0023033B2B|nr:immunoglobulin superfamily member 6 [Hemicordylus capensis]XP_053132523.1 immunoglobulin superfamily member 6 [Hemicordylus capensis]